MTTEIEYNEYQEKYREALEQCAVRYHDMASSTEDDELKEFIELFNSVVDEYPLTKLCRWLGYIQGKLIEKGITTVERERDWTRPLFRSLDYGTIIIM